jgi:hypothetical protein
MELKPGSRWRSAVSAVEIVVVRPPKGAGVLACGGVPMVAPGAAAEGGEAGSGQALMGKRYQDEASGLEALCAKGGAGELSFDGRPLTIRDAKKLPSSD